MAAMMEQGGDAYLLKLKQQQLPEGFWMYSYKVVPCPYTYRHNWTHCPFAHSGETARRRDPTACVHAAELCPRVRSNKPCSDGDSCPFAHNLFEQYLHPTRYRTRLCYFGERCNRSTCFFAHNISELRAAPGEGGPPPEPYYATATELAAAIPAPQQLPPDHLHSLVSLQQRASQQLGSVPQQPPAPVNPGGSANMGASNGGGMGISNGRHVPQIQTVPSTAPSELARQHYEMMTGIAPPEQLQPSHRHSTAVRGGLPHLHGSGGSGNMQGLHGGPPGIPVNIRGPPSQHMLGQGHAGGRPGEHVAGMGMHGLGLYPVGGGGEELRRPAPPPGPWPGPPPMDHKMQQHAYGGAALYSPYDPSQQQQMVPPPGGMLTRYQQQQIQLQRQHAMDRDPGNHLQGWAASANAEYQLACRGKATPYQQQQSAYGQSPAGYSHGGPPPPPQSFHQQHHHVQQQYAPARQTSGSYPEMAGGGRMEAEAQWQLQQQLHYQQQQVLTQQHQQQRQQYSRASDDVYSAQHFSQPMPHYHQQQHHRAPAKMMTSAEDASDNATFPEQVAAAVVAAQQQVQILEAVPTPSVLSSATTASSAQLLQQQSISLSTASSLSALHSGHGSRGQDFLQKQLAMEGLEDVAEDAHYHARRYVSLSGNTYLNMPADYDGGLGFSGGLRPRVAADEQQRIRGSSYSGACYGSDIPLVPTGSEHLLPEFAAASAAVMTRGLDVQQRADMLAAAMAGSSPSALVEALQQQEVVRRASEANAFPISSMGPGRMSYPGIAEGHVMGVHAPSLNPYNLNHGAGNSMAAQQQQSLTQPWQQQQQQLAPEVPLGQGEEISDSLLQMLLGLGLGSFEKDASMLPSRHSDPGQLQDCSMLTHNSLNSMDYDPSLFMNRISDPSGGSVPASVDPMLAELILALQNITGSGSFPHHLFQDDNATGQSEEEFVPQQVTSSSPMSRMSSNGMAAAASITAPASLGQQLDVVSRANHRDVGRANSDDAGMGACMFRGSGPDLSVQAGRESVERVVGGSSISGDVEGGAEVPEFLRRSSMDAGITSGGTDAPSPLLRTVSGAAMSAKLDAFVRHTLLPQLRDAGLADAGGAAVTNQSGDIAIAIGKLLQQLLPGKGAMTAAAVTTAAGTAIAGVSGNVPPQPLERRSSGLVVEGSDK